MKLIKIFYCLILTALFTQLLYAAKPDPAELQESAPPEIIEDKTFITPPEGIVSLSGGFCFWGDEK